METNVIQLKDKVVPERGFFAVWTLEWMQPLFKLGKARQLERDDLWKLPNAHSAQHNCSQLEDHLRHQNSLIQALKAMLIRPIIFASMFKALGDLAPTVAPFVIKSLIEFVTESQGQTPPNFELGLGLVFVFVALIIFQTLMRYHSMQLFSAQKVRLRAAITALIYKKAVNISPLSREQFDAAKIMTLISTDVNRMELFLLQLPQLIISPCHLAIILGFLIYTIGAAAAFSGFGVLVAIIPAQRFFQFRLQKIRQGVAPITEQRVSLIHEILQCIRVVKFYTWERYLKRNLAQIRAAEESFILDRAIVNSHLFTFAFAFPIIASCVSFVVYSLNVEKLNPALVFAALTWFVQIRIPLLHLVDAIAKIVDFRIAINRIEELLKMPEMVQSVQYLPESDSAVVIENGNFSWGEGFSLCDINLKIPKGKLVAIVGQVGSGKSSLLASILGEMKLISGKVMVSGSLGYVSQQAWIQNATIRDNILFGRPFESQKYYNVIRDCALMQDIEFFPDGDNTEIGERGVNLSGGQQQRVNFARMMYQDGDIAILDDPLSAVDAHVGKHLFEEAIKKGLHGKTRILVTHQINYLNQCDYIIVLKNGRIAEQGEYTELLSNNGELSFLMRDLKTLESSSNTNERFENAELNIQAVRKLAENNASAADGIIRKEERETGNVSFKVWRTYVMANGGLLYFVSLCLTLLLSLGSRTMTDIWLSFWANESISSFTRDQYIGVYFGLGLSQAVFYHIVGYVYAHGGVRASQNIYKRAINNIIHAPISFFDSNPIGRILNRFSKDQDAIDFGMLDSFRMFTYTAGICTFVFAVAIVGTPIFSATLIPIMGIYYYVQRYYRHTSVELKRIDSISRSPLYSHISESIKGINTIRAYKKESQFIGRLESLMDQSNSPFYLVESASHWLGVRLETISAVLIFFCAFFGILYRFQLTPSLYGLVLSFIMQVTGMLSRSILQFTLTESAMNAVERLDYYGKVEQEAPYEIANTKPPQEWPRTGTILFENVGLRYKSDGPLVLKGISFKISEKEKIGVVGRTGSGKSSLILALFRMVEPCSGKIMIDGIDVSTIGLLDLRSKIGIIPQFPVLLQGSIRRNLDPFDLFSDEMLWEALEKSSMKIKTIEMGGLDALISQSGDNLSVGQRQLICLGRALLAQNKILIMDEATANVDFETDKAIQDCVNTQFSSTTVITIAHRLATLLLYDRIIVMNNGEMVEFDSPKSLMSNKKEFFSLAQESGLGNMNSQLFL